MSLSVFPNNGIDVFSYVNDLPANEKENMKTFKNLISLDTLTQDQQNQLDSLAIHFQNIHVQIKAYDINLLDDCITNLENFFKNNVQDYIDNLQTTSTNTFNTFINSKETDVTNFVNAKESDMTSIKDAYFATINKKELELQDLDSRTERYWQKWNATTIGQTQFNIFDSSAYNTNLPTTATIDIDPQNIELCINGSLQVPYEDFGILQDSKGVYNIIQLKSNASNLIIVGTEVFISYYKNVGSLYFRHASTHEVGGRDVITVSETMFDTITNYKLNNQEVLSQPTTPFVGQSWDAPI